MSKIDSLTIAEAREIAALFGPVGAAPARNLADGYVGRWVVVRSHLSGVWLGRLEAVAGADCRLADARKAWSWTGAAAVSGLALTGPTGGQITAPVQSVVVYGAVEIVAATDAAVAAWSTVAPWTAR